MKKVIIPLILASSLIANSAPTTSPQKIGVSGRILDMSNQPLTEANVELNIQVKVGSNCVGYEESHILDLSNSKGYFSIKLGNGTSLFGNAENLWGTSSLNCKDLTTYNSQNNDKRSVLVSFKRSGDTVFSQFAEQTLSATSMAKNSERLNGKTSSDFIQNQGSVSQSSVEDLTSGNSSLYLKPSDSTSLNLNQNQISGLGALAVKNSVDENDISGTIDQSKISGLGSLATKSNVTETDITGTISNSKITGLGALSVLNSVSDSEITNLDYSKLLNVPTTFNPSAHSHQISDIVGLQPILNSKLDSAKLSLNCTSNQSVSYSSITDSYSCQSIAIDQSQVSGLGSLAVKNSIDENDISGTISNTKISGLGSLSVKNNIDENDISGTIDQSKISGLGSLAVLNSVSDNEITSLSGNKLLGGLKVGDSVSCSNSDEGTVRYHGSVLEICDGTQWSSVAPTVSNSGVISALGFAPLNPANNLSDLTNISQAKSNLGLGSLADKSSLVESDIPTLTLSKISDAGTLASKSNITETDISGTIDQSKISGLGSLATKSNVTETDITGTISNSKITGLGTLAVKNSIDESDISGTIDQSKISGLGSLAAKSNISETDISGTISNSKISGLGSLSTKNSISNSDILDVDWSKISGVPSFASGSHTHSISDITNLQTSLDAKVAKSSLASCSSSQTLIYTSVSDSFSCVDISISSSAVSGLGTLAAKSSLTDSDIPTLTLSKISDAGSLASKSTLLASDIPNLTLAKISDAGSFASKSSLTSTDITTYLGFTPQDKAKLSLNCTAAQTVQYVSATDSYQCQSIAITSSAVSGLGSLATKSTVADADITELSGSKLTGGVQIGTVSGTTCSTAGLIRYNSGAIEFCDGSSWIVLYSSSAATAKIPKITKLTAGSGTFSTTNNPLYLKIKMIGGGGGGASYYCGTTYVSTTAGSSGSSTTFGTSLLTAGGGSGGLVWQGGGAGTGGSVVVNPPAISLVSINGSSGQSGFYATDGSNVKAVGGLGATSPFGGNGVSGNGSNTTTIHAITNSGSGGGGASFQPGLSNCNSGGGGGAGGYIEAMISNPSASYSYSVGTGGNGGSGGYVGGNGGSGVIIIEEHYQ